jgi:hypothetical protein
MVLNGFAEFIRNLLVCKDAKQQPLLDVVEGMQDNILLLQKIKPVIHGKCIEYFE